MMMLGGSVLVLLLVTLTNCAATDHGTPCGSYNGQAKYIHHRKNGQRACCVRRTCPAGSRGVLCDEDDPLSTHCVACDDDSFAATEAYSDRRLVCHAKSFCDPHDGKVIVTNGSSTADRVCGCDLSRGFYEPPSSEYEWDFGMPHCLRKACGQGYELNANGNCAVCAPGYFKSIVGYGPCRPMVNCMELTGRPAVFPGNHTHDNVCYNASVTERSVAQLKSDNTADNSHVTILYVVIAMMSVMVLVVVVSLLYLRRRYSVMISKHDHGSFTNAVL